MAARPSSMVCLFCRCQGSVITRRRIQHSVKRRMQVVALRHEEGEDIMLHNDRTGEGERHETGINGSPESIADTIRQWKTHIPKNEIREGIQALEAFVNLRDRRREVLRNLHSKSSPVERTHNIGHSTKDKLQLPEAQAAPISHATYRVHMRQANTTKDTRRVLRAQILRVQHPRHLLRIAAVAFQNRSQAEQLAILHEPVMRALYRCRNTVTDAEVLGTCNTIVSRQIWAGLVPHYQLLTIGMKFAARARSVSSMKKYLRIVHGQQGAMTSNVFRSVIAKFSIGHRGLGEIRNGRWRRLDLMQVLTGFDDCKHLPPEQQFHLGVFLDRDDWQYLHGWIAVLARCKASDAVWEEWLLWKHNVSRTNPKRLGSTDRYMDTKWRGDYWFVEQMTYTDDVKRAWRMLEDSQIPFSSLKDRIKSRLLAGVEHASVWTPQMTGAMLEKYDADLSEIERAFGVTWEAGAEDGEGQHVLFRDQEEALDELGDPDWRSESEINYGFPTSDDDSTLLSAQERSLHDAKEGAPISAET